MSEDSKVIYKGKADLDLATKLSGLKWVPSVYFDGIMIDGKLDCKGFIRVHLPMVKTTQEYLDTRTKIVEYMGEDFKAFPSDRDTITVRYGDIIDVLFYIPASLSLMSEIFGCELKVNQTRISVDSVSCSAGKGY
jgi:hypothetical protein